MGGKEEELFMWRKVAIKEIEDWAKLTIGIGAIVVVLNFL